jgi:hypothetical protein
MWYDSVNGKYYIGFHKGTPDDGYTHSSSIMPRFKADNVPPGFRRKILAIGSVEDMSKLEIWLLTNRKEKCWDRYWNQCTSYPHLFDTPEARQKQSERTKKHYEDPEARQKQSERAKKRYEDPEERRKASEIQKIVQGTPEARQKQSERAKKQFEDPEARQRVSESCKRACGTPEARQKKSERAKKHFEDPEARQRASEGQKKRYEDPEARQKQSEAQKKRYAKEREAAAKLPKNTIEEWLTI